MSHHDLGNTQSVSIEWVDFRAVGIGILKSFSKNSGIYEGHDTPESSGGWESRIRADGRDVDNERIEVLLGGDKTSRSGDNNITGSKFGDDQIGL